MITIYRKYAIPKSTELESQNDIFFNRNTVELLDERASAVIWQIDQSKMLSRYTIVSRFDESTLNIDKLSTGCKTALNIMYHPEKVFDIRECGDNALEVIYGLPAGRIYCDYPLIAFDMDAVEVCDKSGKRIIDSYEELKEWWTNEG